MNEITMTIIANMIMCCGTTSIIYIVPGFFLWLISPEKLSKWFIFFWLYHLLRQSLTSEMSPPLQPYKDRRKIK